MSRRRDDPRHEELETLSGGNQQKISIAKWLVASVEILIVDEPTASIDLNTKAYAHELLAEIASSGVSVLLISSGSASLFVLI
jgi:ABC-type sugar transport system ATPase subunit